MRRIQFIELHDQSWFPSAIRNQVTDALQLGLEIVRAYAPIFGVLQHALIATRSHCIVDLCSGGGGPWLNLSEKLGPGYRIQLTDKFPNLAAFETIHRASANGIGYCASSVDAMNVPPELDGFRTMFTSFHHFPPPLAQTILQNAADARQCIGIFEITNRRASAVAVMFVWFFAPFLLTPLVRPFQWSRVLFTYVLPVIPLVMLFDGIVSCLRTYRTGELREMIEGLSAPNYLWEVGEQRGSFARLPITYVIGYPREKA